MEEGVSGPLIKGEPCGGMGPGVPGFPASKTLDQDAAW